MDKIKFANRIIYYIFLSVFIFYIISGLIFSRVDTNAPFHTYAGTEIRPEETIFTDDNTVEYHIKLEAVDSDNMALIFVSRHQEIEVYAGGDLIYYLKAHKSVYGTTTGTNYTMVAIPKDTTDVMVRLTNVYAGIKVRETTFEYGDETDMMKGIVWSSLSSAVLSAFIILVGAGMVLLWLVCRREIATTQSLLYFGIFAMVIGSWAVNETNLATLFVNDRKIASLAGYTLL
ncbi:MAG: GGDEF domain-containing protein, partial [Clostridia bacterium]|nr:GGDEF domain-containing protein [Clostridia bacterium]